MKRITDIVDRIAAKTLRGEPNTCWPWVGAKTWAGYGRIFQNGKMRVVSRVIWEIENGAYLQLGKIILHSCDNPNCVNPAHLSAGTNSENQKQKFIRHPDREANLRRKTHCPSGHALTDSNIYLTHGKTGRGCRTCRKARTAKWQKESRAIDAAILAERHKKRAGSGKP